MDEMNAAWNGVLNHMVNAGVRLGFTQSDVDYEFACWVKVRVDFKSRFGHYPAETGNDGA